MFLITIAAASMFLAPSFALPTVGYGAYPMIQAAPSPRTHTSFPPEPRPRRVRPSLALLWKYVTADDFPLRDPPREIPNPDVVTTSYKKGRRRAANLGSTSF